MIEAFNLNMIWAAVVAALVVLAVGPFLIPELHKLKFGQSIREETPTMGGIMIVGGITIATLIFADFTIEVALALFVMLGHFVLGFLDDYIKVVLKRNLGLKAKQKLLGQFIIAIIVTYIGINYTGLTQDVWIPFIGQTYDIGWFYYVLVIGVLIGTTNAVNLTDGLDGLAAGVSTIATVTILLVALQSGDLPVVFLTAALAGSSLGFLHYNFNPARIFMGDTGSMFLGYMFAAISVIGAVKSAATIALIVPILALGLPILDTTFAIVRRYRGGVPIFKPDKGHLHHRLLAMGFSQRQAVLLMYVFSAFLGLAAIALTEVSTSVAVMIVVFVAVIILFGAKKIGIFSMKNNAGTH